MLNLFVGLVVLILWLGVATIIRDVARSLMSREGYVARVSGVLCGLVSVVMFLEAAWFVLM